MTIRLPNPPRGGTALQWEDWASELIRSLEDELQRGSANVVAATFDGDIHIRPDLPSHLTITGYQATATGTTIPLALTAGKGVLAITGHQATFASSASIALTAAKGVLAVAGKTATVVVSGVSADVTLSATKGVLAVAGKTATVVAEGGIDVALQPAQPGRLSINGYQATFNTGDVLGTQGGDTLGTQGGDEMGPQ